MNISGSMLDNLMSSSVSAGNLLTFFIRQSACACIPIISVHSELDSGL